MAIDNELVDRLLADYKNPEDLTGENGVLRQLTKALIERALEANLPRGLTPDLAEGILALDFP